MLISENKVEQSEALLSELGELNDAQKLDRALIEARISAAKNANDVAQKSITCIGFK